MKDFLNNTDMSLKKRSIESDRLSERLRGENPQQISAKELFKSAQTLGGKAARDIQIAMDNAREEYGCFDMLDEYIDLLGVDGARGVSFIGYPALAMLEQNPLISRVADTLSAEIVRRWCKLKSAESNRDKIIKRLTDELERLKVRKLFKQCAKITALQGGCMLFLDFGASDEELLNPLVLRSERIKEGGLRAFRIVEPLNIYPAPYNASEPLSAGYYDPEYYYVFAKKVHKSWFLKFTTGDLGILLRPVYNFFGVSLSQLMLPYVKNFERSRDASADIVDNFSLLGLKTDMNQVLVGGCADDIIARMQVMLGSKRNYGVALLNKDTEEFFQINTPLSGLEGLVSQQLELFALVSGEPVTKLFGTPPRGMDATGETDVINHNDRIKNWQELLCFDNFDKVLKAVSLHVYGEIFNDIEVEWLAIRELTDKERVEIENLAADRDLKLVSAGAIDAEDIRNRLSQDENSAYFGVDPADLPAPQYEPTDVYEDIEV